MEEWLSTITRVGFTGEEGTSSDQGALAQLAEHMAERLDQMQDFYAQSAEKRDAANDQMGLLAQAVGELSGQIGGGGGAEMARLSESQERLSAALEGLASEGAGSFDAESRMRLRSMDVQMLRILEEISAGRQESIGELRADIAQLTKAVRLMGRRGSDRL